MSKKPTPQPEPESMKRVNHFMPLDMIAGLNAAAKTKGGTASDHLRKAVHTYLRRLRLPC